MIVYRLDITHNLAVIPIWPFSGNLSVVLKWKTLQRNIFTEIARLYPYLRTPISSVFIVISLSFN